ncbi:MAG: hypothetical protein IT204_10925 [Fimbriimonadaceae bacterium]|nr:hypothetical protein [Fimbriimonadaceae bacterium]
MSEPRDVLGLHLVQSGQTRPALRRVRDQLRAADALITVEREAAEPGAVADLRRRAEQLLRESRYEEAEEAFLDSIDAGLAVDWFPWQAAINLVNCQRFLARRDDAAATAGQLQEMYAEQPAHPITYLLATQRGAIAADRYADSGHPDDAAEALHWAQTAYDWQITQRQAADALRAYNLLVALLRCDRRAEALAVHERHRDDDGFTTWCRQGDQAGPIARLLAG